MRVYKGLTAGQPLVLEREPSNPFDPNAIVVAADGATVGVGMGQVNRVDAARLAVPPAIGAVP